MDREPFDQLASPLPSVRMQAAEWFAENAEAQHIPSLMTVLTAETVPAIRNLLQTAVRRVRTTPSQSQPEPLASAESAADELSAVLQNLASMINHELEPAIGWIRSAANREIPKFEQSRTNDAIEKLRRRVRGLVAIAAANRLPSWETISLNELISGSVHAEEREDVIAGEPCPFADDIETDVGLMSVIMENAMQNARDAVLGLPTGSPGIVIQHGVSDRDFWLVISNPFSGTSFTLADVESLGVSTKRGRGLGLSIIATAVARLGYTYDMAAAGGVAKFTLRGRRRRG